MSQVNLMEKGKPGTFNIPLPPDYLFKYRNKNRVEPYRDIMTGQQSSFLFKKYGHLPDGGIAVFTEGTKYPNRGCVFPQALYAANFVKRLTRTFFRLASKDMIFPAIGFLFSPKSYKKRALNRALAAYREATIQIMESFILEDKYSTPLVRELRKIMVKILVDFGADEGIADGAVEIFLMSGIEWDNAYRWRTADIFTATTKEKLLSDPRGEITRLIRVFTIREQRGRNEQTDLSETAKVYQNAGKIISFLLYIPSFKKAFKKAISECDFEKLQLDIYDKYNLYIYDDYDYLGMKCVDRIELFKAEHPDGKFPPRLFYQLK